MTFAMEAETPKRCQIQRVAVYWNGIQYEPVL